MRRAKPWWQKYAWGIAFWVGLIFLMGLGIDALNRDAQESRRALRSRSSGCGAT